MNAYPSIPVAYNQKGDRFSRAILVDEAGNGEPRTRVVHDRRRRSFEITHPWVTRAERDTLFDFFDGNAALDFSYTRTRNGSPETFTCRFTAPPQEEFLKGGRYNVTMTFREV